MRWDIEAAVAPTGAALIDGSSLRLVRVRQFDGPGVGRPGPEVSCDLAPEEARQLAFELLGVAEQAERLTREHTR